MAALVLAAVLVLSPTASAKIESAEAFVRSIYSRYQSKMPDYNGRDADAVFSPSLLQLIRKSGTSGFIGTSMSIPSALVMKSMVSSSTASLFLNLIKITRSLRLASALAMLGAKRFD